MKFIRPNFTARRSSICWRPVRPPTPRPARRKSANSALTKLKFFDISDGQIAELEQTRQPQKTLRILAPQDGFVIEKKVVEGQMVEPGMKIYRLADLGLVWVQAQIYEQDLAYLKLGQEATVTLSYLPDREFRGRVTYIYPNVDEKTRTARVRMEFHNPGYFLKPGMFATVKVVSELEPSALLVPDMAILRSGEKTTVFVALDGGKFDPRTVTLGPQAENDDVSGSQRVERRRADCHLRPVHARFGKPASRGDPENAGAGEGVRAVQSNRSALSTLNATNASPSTAAEAVKYICPMPEHVSIEYDHPGKCPMCGMTLVPVSEAMLQESSLAGRFFTTPVRCRSTATCAQTSRASAPSAA